MKKTTLIEVFSVLGGIALFSYFSPSFSLFNFNSVVDLSTELKIPTENQIQDEKNWQEAQNSLSSFYYHLNLGRYEKAREYLSEGYAKTENNYFIEKLERWTTQKQNDTKIVDLEKETNLSKNTTKVFSYKTTYTLINNQKKCGENLTAYIVLRNNKWTIDTIHPNEYLPCK
ncbi:MAG: hypothetical protein Q8P62_02495 [Candidatus Peregrinibacteria bacterium]|nr:hypothetical protein [Candidatus Peregrinibacteria bacterium]